MSFAIWMIFAATLLPFAATIAAKSGIPNYDNGRPRPQMDRLEGWHQRADWAHRNHIESFAPFAAAVIIALQTGVPANRVDWLAGLFVLARILYTFAYILDKPTLRSLLFAVSYGCVVALFASAALH